MASRGESVVLNYYAYNATTGAPVTGDVANHTLRWIKDGTAAATTNSPSETDSTNCKGWYKVTLTASECTCVTGQLTAQSSTANVLCTVPQISFEHLPTADPGAAGGVFIAGTNAATTVTTSFTTTFTGNLTGSVASVSGSVGSVTGAVGSVTAAVALPSIPANWITAAGIAASALNGKGDWLLPSGTLATVTNLTNAPTAGDLTATMKTSVENAVWNATMSSHLTGGTTGASLNGAGAAGDPWTASLPGAYGAGTAGNIVGNRLDAAVTSRMATYTQPTGFLAATFPATVASPTNITGGTITTVTNLTNLPSIPANWLTAAGIAAGALNGKGDWLLSSGYTAPDNSTISAINTKIGTPSASVSADIAGVAAAAATAVAGITVDGTYTLQTANRLMFAVLTGKTLGAGTSSNVFYAPDGVTARVTTTFDANKDRTARTLNP